MSRSRAIGAAVTLALVLGGAAPTFAQGPPTPREGGAWEAAFDFKGFAIHMALLPTGKVLYWGYDQRRPDGSRPKNEGIVWLYDPGSGTFRNVNPPAVDVGGELLSAPVYCSSQSLLPDGRLLMTGGNARWPKVKDDWVGERFAWTFDPWKADRGEDPWQRQADMRFGRWYPSAVELADGKTLVAGGYNDEEPGSRDNPLIEVFDPKAALDPARPRQEQTATQWDHIGNRATALYPHLFLMPSGDVLFAGPGRGDSAILDPVTAEFEAPILPELYPTGAQRHNRIGSSAVLVPSQTGSPSQVMQLGGYPDGPSDEDNGHAPGDATATTESVDLGATAPGWRRSTDEQSLRVPRAYHNTVLLPEGSMVTVGGGEGESSQPGIGTFSTYADGRSRATELWDPVTGRWRLGARQAEDRTYHSTAVLLPDGRVLSAGDDLHGSPAHPEWIDSAEIYRPPYLFDDDGAPIPAGDRPRVTAAPDALRHGQTIAIDVVGSGLRAVLMAPSATTHGADMQQRQVALDVSSTEPGRLTVTAPAQRAVAPPGWYMLFLIDGRGTPSVAHWLRLGPDANAPNAPGTDPTALELQPPTPRAALDPRPPAADRRPPKVVLRLLRTAGRRVRVRLSADERATVRVQLVERPRGRALGTVVATIGRRARTSTLELTPYGRRALRRTKVAVEARITSTDRAGNRAQRRIRARLIR